MPDEKNLKICIQIYIENISIMNKKWATLNFNLHLIFYGLTQITMPLGI